MNEKNILLLAVLGFGAFFIMSGKVGAATKRPTMPAAGAQTQSQPPNNSQSLQNTALAGGIGLLGQWLGNRATAQQIATEQASEIYYYGAAPDGSAVNVAQQYAENYYSYRGDN